MAIVVENLAKNFADVEIFSSVSFRLEKNEKVGLVGANGEGKTTLMRILLGLEEYDNGSIQKDKILKIGYAAQNARVTGTLWQQLAAGGRKIFALKNKMESLEEELSLQKSGQELANILQSYAELEQSYEHVGGYNYEFNIRKIAFGLGFTEEDFGREATEFSGGQKTRMHLATALLGEPDFLFLDEPTNHLDINMVEWLENYLAEFTGGLLLISHDRYFLDRIVDKVLHLEAGRLRVYRGNYSTFVSQKEHEDVAHKVAWQKQQEHIKETEEYIRRYKAGIKSKQARGRRSQLSRLERLEGPARAQQFKLKLPDPPESADKTLILEALTVGYAEPILHDLSLILKRGEKVALLGKNGTGKTTLLKTVTDALPALSGKVILGKRVKEGYFEQGHDGLFGGQAVLDCITSQYNLSEERARTLLGGMFFKGDDVFKRLGDLSGGERARIAMLKLLLEGANFLILDEPTNHLDIKSCEVVENALLNWPGSVLFVSHDRYFVNKIATKIWEIEKGQVSEYLGDYNYYKDKKREEIEEKTETRKIKRITENNDVQRMTAKSKKTRNIGKQIEVLELSLREQDALLRFVEKRLLDPLEHSDVVASNAIAMEHASIKQKIDELLQEWEELLQIQENE